MLADSDAGEGRGSWGTILYYVPIIAQVGVNVEIYFQESLCVGDVDEVTGRAAHTVSVASLGSPLSSPWDAAGAVDRGRNWRWRVVFAANAKGCCVAACRSRS